MKIEIDTHPDDLPQTDGLRHMTMTIDGRKFTIIKEGPSVKLGQPVGCLALGEFVAFELYSRVDDFRRAEDEVREMNAGTWDNLPDDVAEEVELLCG